MITEDKNSIAYHIDCSIREAVTCGESKQSLKLRSDEYKKYAKHYDCEINEITKHSWEEKITASTWIKKKLLTG